MSKHTVVSLPDRERIADPLTELLRSGARKLIEQAIRAELEELLSQYADQHRVQPNKGTRSPTGIALPN